MIHIMLVKWCIILLICCLYDTRATLNSNNRLLRKSVEIRPVEEVHDSEHILVNGRIYKTFKKYYCRLFGNAEGHRTMLYGKQGWAFPRQDVNVTLVYPSEDVPTGLEDYVIIGYQVILFTDGVKGKAYINYGGVMQDTISMSFINQEITTISYQFWLYGAKRSVIPIGDPHNIAC